MDIWAIYHLFNLRPVFFENSEEKKHFQAIGHAGVKYDASKKEVKFIDRDWDEVISVDEFIKKGEELEASVMTFLYIFNLLRINDLIMATVAYSE